MNLSDYVQDVSKRFAAGNAREHTYRGTLQNLLEDTIPNIQATNEPARIKCGAPDYVLTRKNIPVGYIEAKDIGVDLDKTEKDEQLSRYLDSLDNLILTDYLEFRFFRNKQKVETVRIAEIDGKTIRAIPENFDHLKDLLIDFAAFQGQTIKSAKKLAEMMAGKARMMRDVFKATLEIEEPAEEEKENSLKIQMQGFKSILMHDLDTAQFADIYAQTITYGLFTARLHDETPDTFSRGESLTLIPASNPFLRQLFTYVAGADLDPRVVWIVDALCEVYRATDLKSILKDFGATTGQNDSIVHFYETFLSIYDKDVRKDRGVWYTPEPVVRFIVRAVDDVLKDHFGLTSGIACIDKIDIEIDSDRINKRTGKREKDKKSVHKVQMLDVATGTGTFMAEAIKKVYESFKGQEGLWSRYVDDHLLPRLHGFELLMASYAMCHMKLDLLLQETGYKPLNSNKPPRVGVYLTNSLEEHHPDADTLFASWLSHEANAASRIKRDMPIMVAFGNPPYNNSSTNNGKWIKSLLKDYKKGLNEKKINLDDDYLKFIRLAEYYVEKNGFGIIAMITNNSFLDGKTHRKMRERLLSNFDAIYVLNLNGDVKANLSEQDENVFDIQQGVCISIFVKSKNKGSNKIFYHDLVGKRADKFKTLEKNNINLISESMKPSAPDFYFSPRRNVEKNSYNDFLAVNEIFETYSSGIQTKRDPVCIHSSRQSVLDVVEDFKNLNASELINKYDLPKDGRDWKVDLAKQDVQKNAGTIEEILYRPFDIKFTYYTGKTKGFLAYPRREVMQHMVGHKNYALILNRQCVGDSFSYVSVTNKINCHGTFYLGNRGQDYLFPIYAYQNDNLLEEDRRINIKPAIFEKLKNILSPIINDDMELGLQFIDYILAILHSPTYRTKYQKQLMSDFPRIPYPKDSNSFSALVEKGAALRSLHLMESHKLHNLITTYPVDGKHEVTEPEYNDGKVWINSQQYFGDVPETAWNFYIGGYRPARKWLKDRRDHNLSIEEILHYQRIIVALVETDKIMQDIDKINFLPKEN